MSSDLDMALYKIDKLEQSHEQMWLQLRTVSRELAEERDSTREALVFHAKSIQKLKHELREAKLLTGTEGIYHDS